MADVPPEVKVDLKEPYQNFFTTLHILMLDQIEYTRLRTTLIKIVTWILIVYIAITVILCILSVLLPLFGFSLIATILQQLLQIRIGG